jgi:catechol 2,3-dioxygenase-like lactoylglutathione lyase family enzyme
MATSPKLPSRLHHTAYVTRDLEGTRKFCEELIGLPLDIAYLKLQSLVEGAQIASRRLWC